MAAASVELSLQAKQYLGIHHDISAISKELYGNAYNATNIQHILNLISENNNEFPLTKENVKTLQVAQRTKGLLTHEFRMNYSRFFIGAACGVAAGLLIAGKVPNIGPLLSAIGAGLSGAMGLVVTRIRSINLGSALQNKSAVIAEALKRNENISYTLIKLSFNDNNLAMRIIERVAFKINSILTGAPLHGLTAAEISQITSPHVEAGNFISKGIMPQDRVLALAVETFQYRQRLSS